MSKLVILILLAVIIAITFFDVTLPDCGLSGQEACNVKSTVTEWGI